MQAKSMFTQVRLFLNLSIIVLVVTALLGCSNTVAGRENLIDSKAGQYPIRFINLQTGEVEILPPNQRTAIVFWARWCSYSRPFVTSINEKLGSNPLTKGLVLTISLDPFEEIERVHYFTRKNMNNLLNGFSGNHIYDLTYTKLQGADIPEIHLIDENGILRGITDSYRDMRSFLEEE